MKMNSWFDFKMLGEPLCMLGKSLKAAGSSDAESLSTLRKAYCDEVDLR